MATTRTTLRASLQRKTDSQLTTSADQDLYLDLADVQLQRDWIQFDRSILVYERDSDATDASGVLEMDVNFVDLEYMERAAGQPIGRMEVRDRNWQTGYYYMGWGTSNTKRQIKVMENGADLASTTIYFHALKLSPMGSGNTAEPVIPEEFRDLIAVKAAQLWHQDQGTSFLGAAREWEAIYERDLQKARRAYRNIDDEPTFARSMDPDAGGSSPMIVHNPS